MQLQDAVLAALDHVEDPELHQPITKLGMVKSVEVKGRHATVAVFLTISGCPMRDSITQRVNDAVMAVDGIDTVDVVLDVMSDAQRDELKTKLRGPLKAIPFNEPGNHTRIYAIASGKGGVGKSSVTANLAVAFAQAGATVGICARRTDRLDAVLECHHVAGDELHQVLDAGAVSISPAIDQRTPPSPRVAPTPRIDELMTWVVLFISRRFGGSAAGASAVSAASVSVSSYCSVATFTPPHSTTTSRSIIFARPRVSSGPIPP